MTEGSAVTTREVEVHRVTVDHDGHREVFEVAERHDGSWMIVRTTDEKDTKAIIVAGPWVSPHDVHWCFPVGARMAEVVAAALTEAMGGAK